MRTRKLSSPTETVWVDKHMYDEAERVHYERAAEQLVAEQGNAEEQQQVGSGDLELSGENYVKDEQKQPKNSRKQKRSRRSPKGQASLTKQDCALNGLVLESVWFDKYLYEEAERSFQTKLAADMAEALGGGQPSAKVQSLEVSPGEMKRQSGRSVVNCPHNSTVACHHVVCGFWVNKISFDSAEAAFVERYGSLCPSRPLELPLGFVDFDLPSHRTPDEGYVTAAATPATPGRPVSHLIALQLPSGQPAEKTVNGKPHLSVLQELIAEVWLEKPLYDDAERSFYETPSAGISTPLLLCRSRKSETTKKNKKSGKNLTADGKERMNEREVSLSKPVCGISPFNYFGHPDSERVWLNKFMCDEAESRYHAAGAHDLSSCWTNDRHLTTSQRPSHAVASAPTTQRFKSKKMAGEFALYDKVWFDKPKYDDAEKQYYEQLSGTAPASPGKNTHVSPCKKSPGSHCHKKARGSHGHEEDGASTILRDIARARENIQKSLAGLKTVIRDTPEAKPVHSPRQSLPCISAAAPAGPAGESSDLVTRLSNLELENQSLHRVVEDLQLAISKLEVRLTTLEKSPTSHPTPAAPLASAPTTNAQPAAPVKKVEVTAEAEDDDDDIDLFGSDEEDAEAERIREERLRQYAEKKSKKPALIAKSSILLDVKPWDDETDMAKLEECVRTVQMDGLLWGSSKLVPVGYGIRKLQIQCVVEDDKVGTDILEEEITKFEDYVQSVDIAAFNKI